MENEGNERRAGPLQTCSSKISGAIERFFYNLGVGIGRYPWVPVLLAVLVVGACAGGLVYNFNEETAPEKLWVPDNSQAVKDKRWVDEHFPGIVRFSSFIAEEDNVLTPQYLQALLQLHMKITILEKAGTYSWLSLCARLGDRCWTESILEVWDFDPVTINNLTQQQLLDDVNSITISPAYETPFSISRVLGGVSRDSGGRIVSARAALAVYALQGNSTRFEDETEDENLWDWEKDFLDTVEQDQPGINTLHYYAFRSNVDEGGGAIFDDLNLLSAGYLLVLVFVTVVMGKLSCIQHRFWVSLFGILCIGGAILFAYGLCSYAGLFYGPLHNVLPFLILGIGVDDMFIIVQALDSLGEEHMNTPIDEKMGHVLKRAGVSITVTSLTDIAAFAIGATTVLPALRSFCVYCAVSIIGIYILQATVFTAIVSLDHRRALSWRNACCCCYTHSDMYQPSKCSQNSIVQRVFDKIYIPFLEPIPIKILMLLVTAGLLGFNLYGVLHLEQDFDPNWFIPSDSYASDYLDASDKYFPGDGVPVTIYIGAEDYPNSLDTLQQLHLDADGDEYINTGSLNSWFYSYITWLGNNTDASVVSLLNADFRPRTEADFYSTLDDFLAGPGQRYERDIVFRDNKIWASRATLQHRKLENAAEEIDALDSLRAVTSSTGFSECFPYGFFYLTWEGNRVIQTELYRNLGLAFACVVVVTLILIAHIWTSMLVCSCIIMVVVNIGGLIYWWDLTIDTVTSIILILAIGLAVDYAAHIGHNFMTHAGTRSERTAATLSIMGPPVFYGGFSTLLAFVLLAGSTSYVFKTFFKVFLGVSLFGLFHGLVYLPVMLSLVGPAPYLWARKYPAKSKPREKKEANPHKVNGLPRVFYSNQRTPITATPASLTPASLTPAPSVAPPPDFLFQEPQQDLMQQPLPPEMYPVEWEVQPGTAVAQVTHEAMDGTLPISGAQIAHDMDERRLARGGGALSPEHTYESAGPDPYEAEEPPSPRRGRKKNKKNKNRLTRMSQSNPTRSPPAHQARGHQPGTAGPIHQPTTRPTAQAAVQAPLQPGNRHVQPQITRQQGVPAAMMYPAHGYPAPAAPGPIPYQPQFLPASAPQLRVVGVAPPMARGMPAAQPQMSPPLGMRGLHPAQGRQPVGVGGPHAQRTRPVAHGPPIGVPLGYPNPGFVAAAHRSPQMQHRRNNYRNQRW